MSVRVLKAWLCRCSDGRYWPERPRHMTCADCGALITERELVTVQDALCYSAESIKEASRGF